MKADLKDSLYFSASPSAHFFKFCKFCPISGLGFNLFNLNIFKEIRKTWDEHAKEHNYSVHKISEQLRLETDKLKLALNHK
jgi:hypothetical protein